MIQRRPIVLLSAGAMLFPMAAQAGITVFEQDDKYLELGGRLQAQYLYEDFDSSDEETDEFEFRRLRFYIEAGVTENWMGKWQVDFGGSDANDPEVKDAFIRYTGFDGKLTVGNHHVPFSREQLTSSKRQQLVERTFVGDHNFGVPDRQMGVSYGGGGDAFSYRVGVFEAGIDPSIDKLDFESTTNEESEYTGHLVGARVDIHPGGKIKFAQGDFGKEKGWAIGINAFSWSNDDDDVVDPVTDYDEVTGAGADFAWRGGGFSVDLEYDMFTSETLGSNFTGGIIEDGDGDFETFAAEGGFMLVPGRWEIVAGYQLLDADAFDEEWTRASIGANHFFNGHKDKLQFTLRESMDVEGVDGDDATQVFLQLQHVF